MQPVSPPPPRTSASTAATSPIATVTAGSSSNSDERDGSDARHGTNETTPAPEVVQDGSAAASSGSDPDADAQLISSNLYANLTGSHVPRCDWQILS